MEFDDIVLALYPTVFHVFGTIIAREAIFRDSTRIERIKTIEAHFNFDPFKKIFIRRNGVILLNGVIL